MARKTYNEKLKNSVDMPKVVEVTEPAAVSRYGGTKMLIAPPLFYDTVMKKIPLGQVTTSQAIRDYLAQRECADYTCQLTAGIFINIVAHASVERKEDPTPYWRTLKKDGELNEKYPDGIDGQKLYLEMEGHEIIKKGNKYFVKDYSKKLYPLEG
jgi:alkylated DNA nucleotide flippase Atl1